MTDTIQSEHLSIGFGCSSRACSDDVIRLIETALHPIPFGTTIATLDRRASIGETVASILGLRLVLFPASTLAGVAGITTHSSLALSKTSTTNVAEASALASLGPSARLIVPQTKGRFCTCAVAALPITVRP
ncbi:MAG: cobalamin biosynthesis protein [Acidobacteriaceae bacterium]